MCAIAGIISSGTHQDEVALMCKRMVLRGPDYQGVWSEDGISLGHCRLSILDLSTGNQPMISKDGNVVIVFNGEIYNYREIRNELQEKYKVSFHTTSDTEVIISAYLQWGLEETLSRLEGMFAFGLWDKTNKSFYLVRDRFGEKPLYYSIDNNKLVFASELKAFAPNLNDYTLNKTALNYFLTLSYIPSPYSIYKEIHKLEPGTYIYRDNNANINIKTYYRLADHLSENPIPFEEAKIRIRELVGDSVRSRMVADVPMGAFLSGGIDSSIVCCLMKEMAEQSFDTFSIGFKEREYDESDRAQIVATKIHSNHHLHYLDFEDIVKDIDSIIEYYDEPFGDSSALPSFYVAKLAHDGVKAVLTGDSADELFAGYEKYLGRYYVKRLRLFPFGLRNILQTCINRIPINHYTNSYLRKIRKLFGAVNGSNFDIYYHLMCLGFSDSIRQNLLNSTWFESVKEEIKLTYDECPISDALTKEQYTDIKYVLEGDMFPKVDRACMHNSLENRTPFLSTPLVEFILSLPPDYRLHGKNKKYILKESFRDMLPPQILDFKKHGFSVPIDYWLRSTLKNEMTTLIRPDFIKEQGIFNNEILQSLFEAHLKGRTNNAAQLWLIFVFQKWYLKNTAANV